MKALMATLARAPSFAIMPNAPSNRVIDRVIDRLDRCVLLRPHELRLEQAIISFSFDDFPRSAWLTGGAILERYGVRGTFYLCADLIDHRDAADVYATEADVQALLAAGHELGCHTRSHGDGLRTTPARFSRDLDDNALTIAQRFDGCWMSTFAYPYGRAWPGIRRIAAARFAAARGVMSGLNDGLIDLAMLRANELCAEVTPPDQAAALIAEAGRSRSWLIFFTHDIQDRPSANGCTPAQLEAVVQSAVASGARILTIAQAAATLGLPAGAQRGAMLAPAVRTGLVAGAAAFGALAAALSIE